MSRTLNVVRMQYVNRETYVTVPLIVLGGSLAISLAIYGILMGAGVTGDKFSYGWQAPLWMFAAVGAQAMTKTFPFSQAMSVTRREFFTGTLLAAAGTSAILAIVMVLGGYLEQATNGFWMNGYFFYNPWMWEQGPFGAAFLMFVIAMLFFVIGFWGATLFKRFGTWMVVTASVGLGFVLVAIAYLISVTDSWGSVGMWIMETPIAGIAAWIAVVVALFAATAFASIRRAIP